MITAAFFRRLRLAAFLLAALALNASAQASGDAAPLVNNGQPVNDFANVIDDATEAQLNQKLKDYMKRTNPPVAISVVTVRTTGGRDTFEYSLAIARGWKIGSDRDDNPSALLFVAIDDRKYQTQISRDLEDELPDGVAGQLQRQYLIPAFKAGNYAKGINDTIDAYIRRIDEKQGAEPGATPGVSVTPTPRRSGEIPNVTALVKPAICCFVVIILLLIIIFSRSGGGRGGRGGGYRGGGGSALPWIIGSIIANSGSGSSGSSWGDSGSSWGGGGSSGGSSDWGGFGGGGDFGGGGSGGSW